MKRSVLLRWLKVKVFLVARLQEASTMRALISLAAGGFATAYPAQFESIIVAMVLLVGMVGAFIPDKLPESPGDKEEAQ